MQKPATNLGKITYREDHIHGTWRSCEKEQRRPEDEKSEVKGIGREMKKTPG